MPSRRLLAPEANTVASGRAGSWGFRRGSGPWLPQRPNPLSESTISPERADDAGPAARMMLDFLMEPQPR